MSRHNSSLPEPLDYSCANGGRMSARAIPTLMEPLSRSVLPKFVLLVPVSDGVTEVYDDVRCSGCTMYDKNFKK